MHRRATPSVTSRLASIRVARAARSLRRLALLTASLAPFFAAPAAASDVYVTNVSGISQYNVGATGKLFAKSPATVPVDDPLGGIAVSPDGQSVYAPNASIPAPGISQFDVGPRGRLAPKNPATAPGPSQSFGPGPIVMRPDGRSLYWAHPDTASVSQYHVGAGGKLAALNPAWVFAGSTPRAIAVSPDGQSVYVANELSDN